MAMDMETGRVLDLDAGASVEHWRRLLTTLASDEQGPDSSGPRAVIKLFVPWCQPVRATCYTDPVALEAISVWAQQIHSEGRVNPAVRFTIEDDAGTPVGVLFNPDETLNRWAVLRKGGYLVFDGSRLAVFDERTFHATYCDPAYAYSQVTESQRPTG